MKKLLATMLALALAVTCFAMFASAEDYTSEDQVFVDGFVFDVAGVDLITNPGTTIFTTNDALLNAETGAKNGVVLYLELVEGNVYIVTAAPNVPVWNADLGKVERPADLSIPEGQIAMVVEASGMTLEYLNTVINDESKAAEIPFVKMKLAAKNIEKDMYIVLDDVDLTAAATGLEGTATLYFEEPSDDDQSSEESSEIESVEESSAAAEDSSSDSSPSTGDTGYIAIAVIALVALAGAIIVKKAR